MRGGKKEVGVAGKGGRKEEEGEGQLLSFLKIISRSGR